MGIKVLLAPMFMEGSTQPLAELARCLRGRGHACVRIVREAASAGEAGFGDDEFPLTPDEAAGFLVNAWISPASMVRQFFAVRRAIEDIQPDLVMTDTFALGAGLAARELGVPTAILGLATYLFPRLRGEIDTSETAPRLNLARTQRLDFMLRTLIVAAKAAGVEKTDALINEPSLRGDVTFIRSIPELEGPAHELPDNIVMVGPALGTSSSAEQLKDVPGGHVFVQVEKLFNFRDVLPDLFRCLDSLGVPALASLGGLASRYSNVGGKTVVRASLPLPAAVVGARLTVNTGHSTSTLASLLNGVPVVVLDYGSGAEEVVDRCVRAGVGLGLRPAHLTPADIEVAIREGIEDECLRARARALGRKLRDFNSFELIADQLERITGFRSAAACAASISPKVSSRLSL